MTWKVSMDGANRATLTETVYPEQTPKTTETNTGLEQPFFCFDCQIPLPRFIHTGKYFITRFAWNFVVRRQSFTHFTSSLGTCMFSVELIMNKGNGNLDHAKQNMELNNNISIETKSSKLLPISYSKHLT